MINFQAYQLYTAVGLSFFLCFFIACFEEKRAGISRKIQPEILKHCSIFPFQQNSWGVKGFNQRIRKNYFKYTKCMPDQLLSSVIHDNCYPVDLFANIILSVYYINQTRWKDVKTWFVLSASRREHGHWGWRRHLYEVHAEVRSACRDNSVDGERWHPQWLLPGPLNNVVFVLSCLQSSCGNGWTEPGRQQKCPTLTPWGTSSDPPRQLLLWRDSTGASSSRTQELLQLSCHRVKASHRGRGNTPIMVW